MIEQKALRQRHPDIVPLAESRPRVVASLLSVLPMIEEYDALRKQLSQNGNGRSSEELFQRVLELRNEARYLYDYYSPRVYEVYVEESVEEPIVSETGEVLRPARLTPAHLEPRAELHPGVQFEYLQFLGRFLDRVERDLQGHVYRKEHLLPDISEQKSNILNALYSRNFLLVQEWLEQLRHQRDARNVFEQLEEEIAIVEEILDDNFVPGHSRLSIQIDRSLSGLEHANLEQLPILIDRLRELVALLNRVYDLAESRGWEPTWQAIRRHLFRSLEIVRKRALADLTDRLDGSFEEAQELKLLVEERTAELGEAKKVLAEETAQDQTQLQEVVTLLERDIQQLSEELELIEMRLGGTSLEEVEILADSAIDNLIDQIHAKLMPLERDNATLLQRLVETDRTARQRFFKFFTGKNAADRLRAEREPLVTKISALRNRVDALQARKHNQQLITIFDAVMQMDIEPA